MNWIQNQFFNITCNSRAQFITHDKSNIQTLDLEVSLPGVAKSSLLKTQGATDPGVEVEMLWLATDGSQSGGQYNHVPDNKR